MTEELHWYYLSLTRGLLGYYVLFAAPDENTVRQHAAEYFGRLWCSVYEAEDFMEHIVSNNFPFHIINNNSPIVLHDWRWD